MGRIAIIFGSYNESNYLSYWLKTEEISMHHHTIWIWQQPDWPDFYWQNALIQPLLRTVWLKQGILLGKAGAANGESNPEAALDTLLQNHYVLCN
jgi:hypothetical protein